MLCLLRDVKQADDSNRLIAWIGADDLDKFVSLVGSFACIPLVYIYPPMIHYKAVAKARIIRIIDMLFVVFGFVLMVYTTGESLLHQWLRCCAAAENETQEKLTRNNDAAITLQSWTGGKTQKNEGYCDRR